MRAGPAADAGGTAPSGLGIAFHGSDSLREQANTYIDHNDLTALLYIQGFRKSEFVLS